MQTHRLKDASMQTDEKLGRHLVASANLPASRDVYHSPHAYIAAMHEDWADQICAACGAFHHAELAIECPNCERVRYCSDECRQQHLSGLAPGATAHRHLCASLQQLDPLERQETLVKPRLVLEILARRHAAERYRRDLDEFVALQHHPPSWMLDDGGQEEMAFGAWCTAMREAIAAAPWGARVPDDEVSNDALYALLSRIDVNGFGVVARDASGEPISVGTGIYLGGASLFNHSCEPNCEVIHHGGSLRELSIRTMRPIEANSPLTVSYLETPRNLTLDERQARLRGQYGFSCTCRLCTVQTKAATPNVPPRWLANCHRRGDHYVIAVSFIATGRWYYSLLWMAVYFFFWISVCRYPL